MTDSAPLQAFLDALARGGEQGTLSYDLEALEQLAGGERDRAEAELIARAQQGDLRAIETLGLGACRSGEPALEQLWEQGGDLGLAAARSLLALRGGGELELGRVAAGISQAGALQAALAAYDLRGHASALALRGLLDALATPMKAARANGMLGIEELLGERALPPALAQEVMEEDEATWQPASERLRAHVEQLLEAEPEPAEPPPGS